MQNFLNNNRITPASFLVFWLIVRFWPLSSFYIMGHAGSYFQRDRAHLNWCEYVLLWCRLTNRSWTYLRRKWISLSLAKKDSNVSCTKKKCIVWMIFHVLFYYFLYNNSVCYKQIVTLWDFVVCYTYTGEKKLDKVVTVFMCSTD